MTTTRPDDDTARGISRSACTFSVKGYSLSHAMCAERDEIGQSPELFWQRWETRFLDASWPSIREARAHNTPYVNP